MPSRLILLLIMLACRPASFKSGNNNGNGTDNPDSNDTYKVSLLKLTIKDKTRVAVDAEVRRGINVASNVKIEFKIACRTNAPDETNDEDSAGSYGKQLTLGTANTDKDGVVKRVSDKIFQQITKDDDNRECLVLAITDDGEAHELGTMTINAALRLVFDLGKELVITTKDEVFDLSECNEPKLLVLQRQTIRGVALISTDSKEFIKTPRKNLFERIHVINTVADPATLNCQIYGNIISMAHSVYEQVNFAKAASFEHQSEKIWLKDGSYWRPALQVCPDSTPKTRDGSEVDAHDGDVAKPDLACIAKGDQLLVYYKGVFKLYLISTD
ncbi:MAG: hypothetical protein OYH77_03660 [Pseudomonadota bacterium]|nr:hypothetical protein [Pseudomonadota bacterium]